MRIHDEGFGLFRGHIRSGSFSEHYDRQPEAHTLASAQLRPSAAKLKIGRIHRRDFTPFLSAPGGQTFVNRLFPKWNCLLPSRNDSRNNRKKAESDHHRRATSVRGADSLARQVKDHERIFFVLAPGPCFGDVVGILKADGEAMLMSFRR